MRKTILFILLLSTLIIYAQDDTYNGPAKMNVTMFYKMLEEAKTMDNMTALGSKVNSMQIKLDAIKKKDPNYDTSAMEAALKEQQERQKSGKEEKVAKEKAETDAYKKERDDAIKSSNDARMDKAKLSNVLAYLFKDANLQVGHNNLEFAQKRLDDYKAKTQIVLSSEGEKSQEYVKYISKFNGTMPQFYERNKSLLKDINNKEEYEPAFYELQLYEAYWEAAYKIYPGEIEFKTAFDKLVAYKNSVGSLKDVEKVAAKNTEGKIKERVLPPAIVKDAQLEKFLIDGFNKKYGSIYKGKAMKVVLTQDGWTIEKNYKSEVTGRNRTAKLAYKGDDGKCYLLASNIFIYEHLIGGNFGNREVIYNGLGGEEMLCENVK